MPAQHRGDHQRSRQHPDRHPGAGARPWIIPLRPSSQEGNQEQQQYDPCAPDDAEARPEGLGEEGGVQGPAERQARGERPVQQQAGERAEQRRPPRGPEQPPGAPLGSPGQPPGRRRQPRNGDEACSAKQHQQAGQDDQAIHLHEGTHQRPGIGSRQRHGGRSRRHRHGQGHPASDTRVEGAVSGKRLNLIAPLGSFSRPVAAGDHDHRLATWLAWPGSRWTRFLNSPWDNGALAGLAWMVSVAAALGGSGPAGGEHPVSAGVTGTSGRGGRTAG
jgi:hypothetical protein